MNVKKFSASSSRDALRQVREVLGPDAVILSNRNINGLVEILALASEDMSSLASPVIEKETLAAQVALPAQEATMLSAFAKRRIDTDQAAGLAGALEQSEQARNTRAPEPAPHISVLREMAEMMNELRSMRTMMESQFSELSWSSQQKREPVKATILRELLAAGFSASLSRYLVENVPAGATAAAGMTWIKNVMARNISTVSDESALLEQGGVFALVGPTGVGKTTTTAKLAARCVMRHGPGKLALITTDGYRIGGYEQLRIYGKILGVMVHSVKDESDLRIALDELKNKHTVLIDTVGVSQRDHMVTEQVAMLQGAGARVKRLLCLNATSTGETLNEVVRAYQGSGLAGCVMTKLDEAATIGNVLDVVIRQKLNLFYVANGQRVPEDLHVANKQYLVDRAFKLKHESKPFQLTDAELPLVMAGTTRAANDKTLREVHLG
jgi:flagellar biosynthesis protein FlhF